MVFREPAAENRRLPYLNLPTSSYGKIVMKKYVEPRPQLTPAGKIMEANAISIPVSLAGGKFKNRYFSRGFYSFPQVPSADAPTKATLKRRGGGMGEIVAFAHPEFEGHQVISDSRSDAKLWLTEYYDAKKNDVQKENKEEEEEADSSKQSPPTGK